MPIRLSFMIASRVFHARTAAKTVGGIGEAVFVQRAGDGDARRYCEQGGDNRAQMRSRQQQHHRRCETDTDADSRKIFGARATANPVRWSHRDDGTGTMVMNRSAFRNSPVPLISDVSGQHVAEIGDISQQPCRRAHQRHREQGAGAFTQPQAEIEQRFGLQGRRASASWPFSAERCAKMQ